MIKPDKSTLNWIQIDTTNLSANLKSLRKITPAKTKIMGIVKQSAYGHGLIEISRHLEKQGIDFLGINSIAEASALLKAKVKTPLLILSNTLASKEINHLLKKKVRFSLMDERLLAYLNKQAGKYNSPALVHVKIDTGMNRLGVSCKTAETFIEKAAGFRNIRIEGIYSHLSSADTDKKYTEAQLNSFQSLIRKLDNKGINIPIKHICNSSGALNHRSAHYDMVRIGLLLYGIKPQISLEISLKPALSLKSRIIYIKNIPKGAFVSYSHTYKAKQKIKAGIIPFGYAHGYPWNLSNRAKVIVKGKQCPVIGRICMDHMIINLNSIPGRVNIGQEITLIGKEKNSYISVEDLAATADTIPYEIVSRLSQAIPRFYK
jgi:alanine racemase